ncbi:MAG: putative manganese-dependent inorganic diphosphatase [Lachnospiraceae bacterium]|nr:putative manganese-dependent inorganic diphosphatase [Lachnospiraceae bacterium]
MAEKKNSVLVIGHRNPDTDSICSAIAYARLKNLVDPDNTYEPRRAGNLNEETQYVLQYFGVETPKLVEDVRTQVCDIEFRELKGVSREISLKKAWRIMNETNAVTLPITKKNRLEGLITVTDIASSFMEASESSILSTAHTQYRNIVETLEGEMIVGDEKAYYTSGKVLVAAANPDLMENYIEKNDLVILGNRYESQLCAIEMEAGCIVVCDGASVSLTIRKLAEQRGCVVICTPFDTFTAARQINQSMPISYFMRTERLQLFDTEDFVDDIREVMAKVRHRDFPILDTNGHYVGMISRRNLLGGTNKRIILVDHNERTQAVKGIESAEILEIIDHHRLGTVETVGPVYFRNQPLGCTATIIYQMYQENGRVIDKVTAGLLCSAIISDTLLFRSPTCTPIDKNAALALADIAGISIERYAKDMFTAGSNLKNKSDDEVFHQDYKKFTIEEKRIGVGQISSMDENELADLQNRLLPHMKKVIQKEGVDMIFVLLTNIIGESSTVLFVGEDTDALVQKAFGVTAENNVAMVEGLVSRKKQFIPGLTQAMRE